MITTHVLDLARGVPGSGIGVTLEFLQSSDGEWTVVGAGATDEAGRVNTLTDRWTMVAGTYRLTFDIAPYHRAQGETPTFFPHVQVAFDVRDPAAHFHVPLLVSPFGYSTYRGS